VNWREAMLGVMRGEKDRGLLYVPRLDIWFNANARRGTLPPGLKGRDLPSIAEELGVGLHSVIPDFARTGEDSDLHHRALGFYNHPDFPWRADFSAVEHRVEAHGETLTTTYQTSLGEVRTRIRFGPGFLASGVSIPDILEPAIKEAADYTRVAELLARVAIVPAPGAYDAYRRRIGDRGVAVAFLSLAASPMQHIMRDLRKLEDFFLDMSDDPAPVLALAEVLAPLYDRLVASALGSSAELVLLGANYDDAITYPPFYEEHILPSLRRAGEALHAAGKLLITHTDGENRLLLPLLRASGFDVADSVCPAPMTRVDLRGYREALGTGITIWGGIPSILVLPNSVGEAEFRAYIDGLAADPGLREGLILSVADTLPPDADFGRVLYIRDELAAR
jgi:hypothetical protein